MNYKGSFFYKSSGQKMAAMPHHKFKILPQNLIQHFYYSFSIYGLLLHFHSIAKNTTDLSKTVTYNFSAFLTLDKSRKIIRKKEDEFVAEMVRKIEHQAEIFVSKHPNEKELYKITYAELEKLIELFESRKGQFVYFEKSFKQIEKMLKAEKKTFKNTQTINHMKDTMDDFHQKLLLVLKKYEQKTHVALLGRLKKKISRKFSQQIEFQLTKQNTEPSESLNHQNPRMLGIYKIQSECQQQLNIDRHSVFKRSASKKKTRVLNKFGDVQVNNQNIQKIKRQILSLKSKYHKMNCRTSISKSTDEPIEMRHPANRTCTLQTNADSDMDNSHTLKDQETNASEVKYSIRLTQGKKLTKANSSSFSIFDKKTHHASFILKNAPKAGYDGNAVITDEGKTISGQILRKGSSFLKTLPGDIKSCIPKKGNNSVYRQTNFAVQAQQKLNQKRVSTGKPRESLRHQSEHKQYQIHMSQTEANIEDEFYIREVDFEVKEGDEEDEEDVYMVQEEKKQNGKVEMEGEMEGAMEGEMEGEMEGTMEEEAETHLMAQEKKSNNRRKGFSRNQINTQSDLQSYIAPSAVSIKRTSQTWTNAPKPQKSYNRTSFFRTSGYTPKKSMIKPTKTKFTNISKKLRHHDSKDLSPEPVIDHAHTQKTIRTKGLQKDKMKKQMKGQEMAVTAKDCKNLYDEINAQRKNDEIFMHQSQLLTMMRQKYDLRYKQREGEEQNDGVYNPFRNQPMMIVETENEGDESVGKWTKGRLDHGETGFMRCMISKFNELGQKELGVSACRWQDDMQCIKL